MVAHDQVLLQRWVARQDAAAFTELVNRYADLVYGVGWRVLGDQEAAKDVAQDSFLKLARHAPELKTSLGGWLHRATTNAAINVIKKEATRRRHESHYVGMDRATATPEWRDIQRLVDEAVDELPEKYRLPLVAHYFEQQTHQSIADDIGISRQAVTHRIQRGIERLRRHLKRKGLPIAGSLLATNLAGNVCEAAPAALRVEASKIALSGVAPLTSTVSSGMLAIALKAGSAALLLVAAFVTTRYITSPVEPSEDRNVAQASAPLREEPAPPVRISPVDAEARVRDGGARPQAAIALEDNEEIAAVFVSGIVSGADGVPIPEVIVTAIMTGFPVSEYDPASRHPFTRTEAFLGSYDGDLYMTKARHVVAVTDRAGRYSLDVSLPGGVVLIAAKDGYASANNPIIVHSGRAIEDANMTLLEGGFFAAKVVTERGFSVTDAVVRSVMTTGLSSRGTGVPTSMSDNVSDIAYTDSNGQFMLSLSDRSKFVVEVDGVTIQVVSPSHGSRIFVDLAPGENTRTLVLGEFAVMSGIVRWEDGSPASGLRMELIGEIPLVRLRGVENVRRRVSQQFNAVRESVVVDEVGAYTFADIDIERMYSVSFFGAQGEIVQDKELPDFALGERRDWNYTIENVITIHGRVLDRATGNPITGPRVYARKTTDGVERPKRAMTEIVDDGSYTLRLTRGPGDYYIIPSHTGHFRQTLDQPGLEIVSLAAGEDRELDLKYFRAFTRSFRITDEAGNPVTATARIYDARTGAKWGPYADRDGLLVYEGFPPGLDTWVTFTYPGFSVAQSSHYTGTPGEIVPEEAVVLKSDSEILGLVLDPSGVPVQGRSGVLITFYAENDTEYTTVEIDQDGLMLVDRPSLKYAMGAVETLLSFKLQLQADFGEGERTYEWTSELLTCFPGSIIDFGDMRLSARPQ